MRIIFLHSITFLLTYCCYAQSVNDYIESGVAKANSGDYKGAIQDYTKAIELKPNTMQIQLYYHRASCKHNLQDYRGAILDYSKVIELKPNFAKAYLRRGVDKILLKQEDSGCLDLSKAGELGDAEAYELIKKFCQ